MVRTVTSSLPSRSRVAVFGASAALALAISGWFFVGGPGGGVPLLGGQVDGQKRDMSSAMPGKTSPIPGQFKQAYAPGVVVVAYHANTSFPARDVKAHRLGLIEDPNCQSPYFHRYFIDRQVLALGETVDSMVNRLKQDPEVRFAEPDFAITPDQALPNDPRFSDLWGLHNTGQTGGTIDDDVDAPDAWQAAGSNAPVTVAVMDDGCQWDHVDLAANIWSNAGEIPGNGIDDDANGKVDDIRGWDFSDNDNNPYPKAGDGHGTHTSGTVAAVAHNGVGIAGVAKFVKLMPVRIYGGSAQWMTALANGIDYAWQNGAKVISVSYNIDGYTQALLEAIQRAGQNDVIYCNSAGNNGQANPPRQVIRTLANNAVFVAATDHNDMLASFSNYGTLIEIGAPGVNVLSTVPTNNYDFYDGTSMACPHMAGACAVILGKFPNLTARQALDRLIGTADHKPNLDGFIAGGRLNMNNALDDDSTPPSDPTDLAWLAYASQSIKIRFNGSGDDGTAGQASSYEVRISPNPITQANFGAAQLVAVAISPVNAGVPITAEIGGLAPGSSMYVGIRAVDNLGNVSNVLAGGPYSTRAVTMDTVEGSSWFAPVSGQWAMTSESPYQGAKSWSDSPGGNYADNANVALASQGVQMRGPSFLRFMVKYSLESGYDYLWYDASLDNGATWVNLGSLSGESGGWKAISAVLPAPAAGPGPLRTVKLRFRLTTDSSVVKDGVYLDNLYLTPIETVFVDNMEGTPNFSGDAPWALTTSKSASPTRSWTDSPAGTYGNSISLNLTAINPVDTSGLAGAAVTFKAYMSTESGYDYFKVLTASNGGSFGERARWSGVATSWNTYSAPIPEPGLVRVRFNLSSDGSVVADGVYLDDVKIVGEPYSPAP